MHIICAAIMHILTGLTLCYSLLRVPDFPLHMLTQILGFLLIDPPRCSTMAIDYRSYVLYYTLTSYIWPKDNIIQRNYYTGMLKELYSANLLKMCIWHHTINHVYTKTPSCSLHVLLHLYQFSRQSEHPQSRS